MEPQFITPDDFENYWGVNLREKLKNNSNPSNKANMFLKRIEIRVMNWIDANTFRVTRWDNLTEFQLEHFRIALLEQAMYVYRNTDLALDSAYDPEKGFIVQSNGNGSSSLKAIEICEPTLRELKLAGLYNLNILNRNRYTKILR
jgi:hypothetical protein